MWLIATNVDIYSGDLTKTDEPIKNAVRMWTWTWVGPRNHVLDGVKIPPRNGALLDGFLPIEKHCKALP